MKKYTTPEIETLALDTIDVITASARVIAEDKINEALNEAGLAQASDVQQISQAVKDMSTNLWSW